MWTFALPLLLSACASSSPMHAEQAAKGPQTKISNQHAADLLQGRSFASGLLKEEANYHVYLPQAYEADTDRAFPVIYWLHGSGGYPPGVLQMLASRFDAAIEDRRIPAAIVVFPVGFEDTLWANAADGTRPVEDMFVRELIPHVDSSFRTVRNRGGRLLEGASMGGYGAARLAFRYPGMFGAVSMINPGPMQRVLDPDNAPLAGRARAQATLDRVFSGSAALFERQSPWVLAEGFAKRDCPPTRIRMIVGETDPTRPTNLAFSDRLKALGIAHEVTVVPDAGHNPGQMFANMGASYWTFFARALESGSSGATACRKAES